MVNSKTKTRIYAPEYYKDFVCIASRCRHSCCINWEICIDSGTWLKYKKLGDISCTVNDGGDFKSFKLREDGRCLHLNDDGLCKIILNYGEDYLCEICQKHPRFYNCINNDRIEAGLGIVCEEACRIILENENMFSLSEIEETDDKNDAVKETDFNALPERNRIIALIEEDGEFEKKLDFLKTSFNLPHPYSTEAWLERYLSLEILDEEWAKDLKNMKDKLLQNHGEILTEYGKYYKKLLTYFVYRHVSIATDKENLRARLAFCILSTEIIKMLFEGNLSTFALRDENALDKLIDWSRRYSAEIEYSEDNTDELIFAFESAIYSQGVASSKSCDLRT